MVADNFKRILFRGRQDMDFSHDDALVFVVMKDEKGFIW